MCASFCLLSGCALSPGMLPGGGHAAPSPTAEAKTGPSPTVELSPQELIRAFDVERALGDIRYLAEKIGPRPLGSAEERAAAGYIARQLDLSAWKPTVQDNIRLFGTSLTTQNVVGAHPQAGKGWIVIAGAHYDSVVQREASPGANDNGSGVAVLLEVARVMKDTHLPYELRLAFFGGEERTREQPEVHHVGSDCYVRRLNEAQRSQVLAMISVDMVGAGPELIASRVGYGTDRARQWLLHSAERLGLEMTTDTGKAWSDHEAFELAGIPSVWLTRMGGDEHWHTAQDKVTYIGKQALTESGRLTIRFLLTLAEGL